MSQPLTVAPSWFLPSEMPIPYTLRISRFLTLQFGRRIPTMLFQRSGPVVLLCEGTVVQSETIPSKTGLLPLP